MSTRNLFKGLIKTNFLLKIFFIEKVILVQRFYQKSQQEFFVLWLLIALKIIENSTKFYI